MKKIIGLICVILAWRCHACCAGIIQTNKINVIEATAHAIRANTLVIFDIDDALIMQ